LPLQMRSDVELRWWLACIFLVISGGVAWLTYTVPPELNRLAGGFLLAVGTLNIFLHRRIGRQSFSWTRSMPSIVAKFWDYGGERGAQLLYLGIGMILAAAGCVLLLKSALTGRP
jgi:hypothetical protein